MTGHQQLLLLVSEKDFYVHTQKPKRLSSELLGVICGMEVDIQWALMPGLFLCVRGSHLYNFQSLFYDVLIVNHNIRDSPYCHL